MTDLSQLSNHRGEFYLEDNPAIAFDGAVPNASAVQAVFATAATRNHVVRSKPGRIDINDQVTLSAPFRGPSFGYAPSSRGGLALVPSFNDATKAILDATNVDGVDVRDVFLGDPGATGAGDALNAIGLRLGRPGQTPETTYKAARYLVDGIRAYGVATGFAVQGWSGDLRSCHAQFCTTGLVAEYLNAGSYNVRMAGNVRDFAISKSSGFEIFALFEGDELGALSSTLDDCHGFTAALYCEHATTARSTPLLTVGGTTECTGIDIVLSVGALMSLTAGVRPIKLDKVNGGTVTVIGSSGSAHALIETTENTRNVRIILKSARGMWPLDNAGLYGPAYNYFPNPQFDAWFRGWQDVVLQNLTMTRITAADRFTVTNAVNNGAGLIRLTVTGHPLLTGMRMEVRSVGGVTNANGHWTVTRIDANTVDLQGSTFAGTYTSGGALKYGPAMIGRGQNAILLKSSGAQTANNIEFRLCETHDTVASPAVLALRGKRVRLGAWIFVPNLPDFAEALEAGQRGAVASYCYNVNSGAAATVTSDVASPDGYYPGGSYGHHTCTNQRQFIYSEMEVQTDATVLYLTQYMNQGGTMTGTLGDVFIVLQSMHLCDARLPLEQMMAGKLVDAPDIDARLEGGLVTMITDRTTLADATQTYTDGDEIRHRTTAVGSPRGRTVTTGGAGGGTAVLTAWANL